MNGSLQTALNSNQGLTVRKLAGMSRVQTRLLSNVGERVHQHARREAPKVVVTRHPALVQYLVEKGIVPEGTPVLQHAKLEDVEGMNVIGVLPLFLASKAAQVTEVSMDIPVEKRGVELTIEDIRQYVRGVFTYQVEQMG
jgi:putative CRISPR-associated protein (TIGR02620 family)